MDGRSRLRRLTDDQAVSIRTAFASGHKSMNQLAAKFGLSTTAVKFIVEGATYKTAGGPITWPGQRVSRNWRVRGWCKEPLCHNPVAESGWAQRMHLCNVCFRVSGGKKSGRPRTGKEMRIKCCVCGSLFKYYVKPKYRPRCCSLKCGAVLSGRKRSARPKNVTGERLYEMYWGQNMTMPEIVAALHLKCHWATVRRWLVDLEIPRRATNWRTYTHCVVDGCGKPRFEQRQWNGQPYGRLCHKHLKERNTLRKRIYEQQRLESGADALVRDVAKLLVGLPDSVRADAQQEIVLAALADELLLPLTRETVKPFISRAFEENADAYRFLSLQAPTRDGEDAQTWGERLGLC